MDHRRPVPVGQRNGVACWPAVRAWCWVPGWRGPVCRAWRFVFVLNTLLAVPSVVVGLVVYLLLSRSGPLGSWGWLFSFKTMVLARRCWCCRGLTALTRQMVEDADRAHGEQLRSLGASPCAACCWPGMKALCLHRAAGIVWACHF